MTETGSRWYVHRDEVSMYRVESLSDW
jgi:hypothetical protein